MHHLSRPILGQVDTGEIRKIATKNMLILFHKLKQAPGDHTMVGGKVANEESKKLITDVKFFRKLSKYHEYNDYFII